MFIKSIHEIIYPPVVSKQMQYKCRLEASQSELAKRLKFPLDLGTSQYHHLAPSPELDFKTGICSIL